MNNVNTSKDKSRLILLHITIGGLITVHKWQILSHTTPGFSARHITPLQWRPPGGTAIEEEGSLGGRPRGGGGAGATSAWPKCGFRQSIDTTSALPPMSTVKHLSPPLSTRYGPAYRGWREGTVPPRRMYTNDAFRRLAGGVAATWA
jgi:hypothetical protein